MSLSFVKTRRAKGAILIMVLVFTIVFMIFGGGILNLIRTVNRTSLREANLKKSLNIAEAGINYYRWHLAHLPSDFGGSGDYDYFDPYGGKIGQYTLTITPPSIGSTVVTVKSKGAVTADPPISKTIEAKFGKKSYAEYALLSNTDVWFGEGEEVAGKVHSNGGVRMDGEADSTVDSPRETYQCQPFHGCNAPYEEKPGVWGTGEKPELWRFPPAYPITAFDFNKISIDLGKMKEKAKAEKLYIDKSGAWGWHLNFNFDNTVTIYKVTRTYGYYGYDHTDGWKWRYIDIRTEVLDRTVSVPSSGIIFVEDNVWVSGEVGGRVTVASANLTGIGSDTNIIIHGNTAYKVKDGSAVLGLIAQKDVLLPRRAPDKLEIDAALLAQKGHVYYYYFTSNIKTLIELYGIIVTNTTWTWSWVNYPGGPVVSGYKETETTYDPYLLFSPPPYFPTKDEYELISWRETKN